MSRGCWVALAAAWLGVVLLWWSRPVSRGAVGIDGEAEAVGYRVLVNRASATELTVLHGIGEKTAEHIVREREAGGDFKDVDDLQRADNIGAITARRVGPWLDFGSE